MSVLKDLYLLCKYPKPRGLIQKYLPHTVQKGREHWACVDTQTADETSAVSKALHAPDLSSLGGIKVYRHVKRRRVFRINTESGNSFVKAFFFNDSFAKQFYRYRLCALDEALGLLLARERGIPVPDVISYGEKRIGPRRLFNVATISEVENAEHPKDIFKPDTNTSIKPNEALQRLIPLFQKIYHAGCNHIDLHTRAFLLSRDTPEADSVIDFQSAVFYPAPSHRILCHQLARFAGTSQRFLGKETMDDWAEKIIQSLSLKNPSKVIDDYHRIARDPISSAFKRITLQP